MILNAFADLRRRGNRRVMEDLESFEPDLTEHILETLTTINHELFRIGASRRDARRLYRQIRSLVLVSVVALRHAQTEMWRDLFKDAPPPEQVKPPAIGEKENLLKPEEDSPSGELPLF